ncbi:M14 family metallopeptidase [Fulvivirga imtechensis]|nr:M14 family metallopeptidase [Fulvivirga imtechensis]
MKRLLTLILFISQVVALAQNDIKTVFEQSNGQETGTHTEVIAFYEKLAQSSPDIQIRKMGETDSGLPLHLVILDADRDFDLERSREKGKTVILINNGIHPGEADGIEASQMLLRDFAFHKERRAALKDIVLAVIPVYNIGGALNRNSHSRANQNGPKEYGFRGNARNYDLNRDFIKADAKNTRSFYEIFHLTQPDIFIDTHVSNGADYQYSITHLATQHNKLNSEMGRYIDNQFTPKLEALIKKKGSEITPYVNVFNNTPDAEGITQFMDHPTYSTGYTALFNTLGFMIETHMLKPFNVRVMATYDFLEAVIDIAGKEGKEIQRIRKANKMKPGERHPIAWKLDRGQHKEIPFKGYEGAMVESKVTGQQRLYYDRNKPFSKTIPYYNTYVPAREVTLPVGYVVPQGWHAVIDRLKWNGLKYTLLSRDTTINVEAYRIEKYNTSSSAYEGHYPHNSTEVSKETKTMSFSKGDYIFHIDQPGGRYLVETLEPEATDSFFNWNFFDTILQQKEHFSPYVFEEAAWDLLQNDPELKQAFEAKKKENKEFSESWYAQLDFIFKRSPYYENAHLQYPVYRLVE